jgi:hypothetical protein
MVPVSDCFCDECVIKYYQEGLIDKGTVGYEEAKRLIENQK